MDVEHRLSGRLAMVHDYAIALGIEPQVPGDLRRAHDRHTDDSGLLLIEIIECRDVLTRNDQHVRWRLRVDVVERDDKVVLKDFLRGDLAGGDAAEEATIICGHGAIVRQRARYRRGR